MVPNHVVGHPSSGPGDWWPVLAPWHIRSKNSSFSQNGCAKEPAQDHAHLPALLLPGCHRAWVAGTEPVPLRFLLSTQLLDMKQNAADRFVRDPIRGCHCTERFLLLHHTLHHGRPVGSRKTVCWLLWPWPPLLDHRRRRACLSWFLRSLADVAPSDTVCQMGQGRGKKLVTEDPKPVGSGRFREQTRDAEAVPGLFLALLIRDLPPSVSLLCELDPIWWKTKIVTLPRFGGVLRGE